MGAIFALGGLAVIAFAAVLILSIFALVIKVAVRLLLLPLLLIKWIVAAIGLLIVGPILFVVGVIAFFAVGFALIVPLLPLLLVAGVIWLIVRANRRPAIA